MRQPRQNIENSEQEDCDGVSVAGPQSQGLAGSKSRVHSQGESGAVISRLPRPIDISPARQRRVLRVNKLRSKSIDAGIGSDKKHTAFSTTNFEGGSGFVFADRDRERFIDVVSVHDPLEVEWTPAYDLLVKRYYPQYDEWGRRNPKWNDELYDPTKIQGRLRAPGLSCKKDEVTPADPKRDIAPIQLGGGWHSEKAGSTGAPVGRPKKGLGQPYKEMGRLADILGMDKVGKSELGTVLAADRSLNMGLLADYSRLPQSTLYRYRKTARTRGRTLCKKCLQVVYVGSDLLGKGRKQFATHECKENDLTPEQADRMEAKLDRIDSRLAMRGFLTPDEEALQAVGNTEATDQRKTEKESL
jgi:hypothetical protein